MNSISTFKLVSREDRSFYVVVLERLRKMLQKARQKMRSANSLDILDRVRMRSGLNSLTFIRGRMKWFSQASETERFKINRDLERLFGRAEGWWEKAAAGSPYRIDWSQEVDSFGMEAVKVGGFAPNKMILLPPGAKESRRLTMDKSRYYDPSGADQKVLDEAFAVVENIERTIGNENRPAKEASAAFDFAPNADAFMPPAQISVP